MAYSWGCVMRRFAVLAVVALSLFVARSSAALGAEGEAFTNPQQAGVEHQLQGEYQGTLKTADGDRKVGVQIIALGDGMFEAVAHFGGLPGDGWSRGDERKRAEGRLDGQRILFQTNEASAVVESGKIRVSGSGGEDVGTLDKVERKSPTLGEKPPAGALVLFDGSNVDHFPGAKMTDDKLLKAGALGKDELGDHRLHIEFRTPFMPKARGQGRGNSGVYLQHRYEVQVLDSFGLEGENNECGGIYSVAKPDVNMCLPPLAWQTYDVDFTAAKFDGAKRVQPAKATIKHNGVVIFDGEISQFTPGGAASEAPGRGPLFLQDHGNPVAFRNIWVVKK